MATSPKEQNPTKSEEGVDKAVEDTFPASDPPATGEPRGLSPRTTSTKIRPSKKQRQARRQRGRYVQPGEILKVLIIYSFVHEGGGTPGRTFGVRESFGR